MKFFFILNAAPDGDEKAYNGLRLARALAKRENHQMRIFLMGDAASTAKKPQKMPEGFYNLEVMLSRITHVDNKTLAVFGTCVDAPGIDASELINNAHRSTLNELADWTEWAD